jgi:DNA-binding NarL/FixJ family response regulator
MHGSFQLATVDPEKRIPVVVHAPDPISQEGTISQLRQHPEADLVDEATGQGGHVAVLFAESPDQALLSRLRRLVRSEGLHPARVVNRTREAELLDVIECSVGAILWRHEATGGRLLKAVTAAFHGDGDLPSDLLGRLINQVGALRPGVANDSGTQRSGLTPREIDVLRLVAERMGTGEIVSKLSYSERTAKNIMQGLTTRPDLRNRAHAVASALREGTSRDSRSRRTPAHVAPGRRPDRHRHRDHLRRADPRLVGPAQRPDPERLPVRHLGGRQAARTRHGPRPRRTGDLPASAAGPALVPAVVPSRRLDQAARGRTPAALRGTGHPVAP